MSVAVAADARFCLTRSQQLAGEHYQTLLESDPNTSLLDAWLDFAAMKFQAETPEEGDIREGEPANWHYVPKPNSGYLVPLMTGYQRISALYSPAW